MKKLFFFIWDGEVYFSLKNYEILSKILIKIFFETLGMNHDFGFLYFSELSW
uniref:Uncharacterized protein n=1 Tax=viral metagenome TaxID=1070528 RepID=A0A6C0AE82_9ZZZZ